MSLTPSEIDLAYRLIFDREPSDDEIAHTAAHHETLSTLRPAFLNSDEFSKKYTRLRDRMQAGARPALVHIHIPKTAGTTMAEALAQTPGLQPNMLVHDETLDELRALPPGQRRALRYIRGHLSIGAGEILGAPYRHLCAIRRPGPRIFSFYQYIRRTRSHPSFGILTERDMSFGDYLEYSVDQVPHRLELDNGQIRRLAGRFNHASLGQETTLLRTALYNALSPKMIFGFVEHFDALIARLVEEGFLPDADIETRNVSPNSDRFDAEVAAMTDAQRRIFDSYIAWDTYFYDVAHALLLPQTDARADT